MPTTRACRRSSFPRPYICRLTSSSLQIWPSVWPLDHPVLAPVEIRTFLAACRSGQASAAAEDCPGSPQEGPARAAQWPPTCATKQRAWEEPCGPTWAIRQRRPEEASDNDEDWSGDAPASTVLRIR